MNDSTRSAIVATFEASNAGRIHFGEVIAQLVRAEVESYHVDYRAGRAVYYLPDGETLDMRLELPPEGIAADFDGAAVRAAIAGAQRGQVMYPEFKHLSQRAGCVGYTVWIAGRHVVYLGRKGETHVEPFPS